MITTKFAVEFCRWNEDEWHRVNFLEHGETFDTPEDAKAAWKELAQEPHSAFMAMARIVKVTIENVDGIAPACGWAEWNKARAVYLEEREQREAQR